MVQIATTRPEEVTYEPVDDSEMQRWGGGLGFASLHQQGSPSSRAPSVGNGRVAAGQAAARLGGGPRAGLSDREAALDHGLHSSMNPIARGNSAIRHDAEISDSKPDQSRCGGPAPAAARGGPGAAYGSSYSLSPSKPGSSDARGPPGPGSKFSTKKQAVDAEVRRLKENNPVFTAEIAQDHTSSARLRTSSASLANPDSANLRQSEQSFTKPAYLHNREKHYSGSGVAGLLGGGGYSNLPAPGGDRYGSLYQNAYSSSTGTRAKEVSRNELGKEDIKQVHSRRGPIF